MAANADPIGDDAHELIIERVYDVPRALAFEVWADPKHLVRWWGPRDGEHDYTMPVCEMDFRPGGAYRFSIMSPSGTQYWQHGTYREIVAPERLVFTFKWGPEGGQRTNEMLIEVTFTALARDRTRVRFVQRRFVAATQRDGHRTGWNESFDRLASYLGRSPR